MILGKDVVHVGHVLAGDLLDDERAVVGVEEQPLPLVVDAPRRGAAGQRHLGKLGEKDGRSSFNPWLRFHSRSHA